MVRGNWELGKHSSIYLIPVIYRAYISNPPGNLFGTVRCCSTAMLVAKLLQGSPAEPVVYLLVHNPENKEESSFPDKEFAMIKQVQRLKCILKYEATQPPRTMCRWEQYF